MLGRAWSFRRKGRTTMGFRRRSSWTRAALAVVLAIGGPLTAGAQNRGAANAELYTPAACGEGIAGLDDGNLVVGREPGHVVRRRRREGARHLSVVGYG